MNRKTVLVAMIVALVGLIATLFLRTSGLGRDPGLVVRTLPQGRLVKQLPVGTPFEQRVDGFVFSGTIGNLIDDNVYFIGSYEPHVLGFLREAAQKSDAAVFLDIGANVGQHSLFLSKYVDAVHAVEPWPVVLARLDSMIAANGIDNITVHRVGYAAEPGSLPFYAPPDGNLGMGSFDPDFSPLNTVTVQLPLVVGDDHLATVGVSDVDILKIDIEGYERLALQGLQRTLHQGRPLVLMELNLTEGGFTTKAQMDATFPKDYRWYRLGVGGGFDAATIEGMGWSWMYGPGVLMQYDIAPYDHAYDEKCAVVGVPEELVGTLGL